MVFHAGIDFYKAALEKAARAEGVGDAARQFVLNELQAVDSDREYREQVVERKIGAVILPLALALPGGCRVDFERAGNRRARKIICT